jgi:hypothetical protein
MTGRRMGYCAGYNSIGSGRGFGYGHGRSVGGGRGFGYGYGYGFRNENVNIPAPQPATAVQSENSSGLSAEIEGLKSSVNAILARLDSLSTSKKKDE